MGNKHGIEITQENVPTTEGWTKMVHQATCKCGWTGEQFPNYVKAEDDGAEHIYQQHLIARGIK